MLAIAFRFPAGRYHATPWERHVNEADVEWPPAPWRILRGLVATWHRKADQDRYPEPVLIQVVEEMAAALPTYRLPPVIRAHSRHYMPVREGKRDKPALIFDAFVRSEPTERLIAVWPDTNLARNEQELLAVLLRDIGFLGRAESWVEATLLDDWDGEPNCWPSELIVNTETGEALEPIRLISPVPAAEYAAWRKEIVSTYGLDAKKTKKSQQNILATTPERLIDAMRLETGEIQRAGWSCPPGARYVTYQRPYACFTPQPRSRSVGAKLAGTTTVRLALAGKPLPQIEDAVRMGELMRVAAMYQADRMVGTDGIPAVLSGHEMPTNNRHGHAFYLPEDADGDGFIDHVLIHAENGLSGPALRALDRITRLWEKGGAEWQVLLERYGRAKDFAGHAYMAESRKWLSVTPYLHPWFAKKRFAVEDQIRRECRERGLPAPELERLPSIAVRGRQRRPVHFHRFRGKHGLTQPDTQGSFWKLTFPSPIRGPIALGFACHFGLGIFAAIK